MVIKPSPELERMLVESAQREGVAPESLAIAVLEEKLSASIVTVQPRDEWERGLMEAARKCGVSRSDADFSSDALYDQ